MTFYYRKFPAEVKIMLNCIHHVHTTSPLPRPPPLRACGSVSYGTVGPSQERVLAPSPAEEPSSWATPLMSGANCQFKIWPGTRQH